MEFVEVSLRDGSRIIGKRSGVAIGIGLVVGDARVGGVGGRGCTDAPLSR